MDNIKTSGEKVEKAKSWAKRLECPVDEDAGYHNTFVSARSQSAFNSLFIANKSSGATEISSRSHQTDKHGPGKAMLATGKCFWVLYGLRHLLIIPKNFIGSSQESIRLLGPSALSCYLWA